MAQEVDSNIYYLPFRYSIARYVGDRAAIILARMEIFSKASSDGSCFYSLSKIMADHGCTKHSAIKSIKTLIDYGLIKRIGRATEYGSITYKVICEEIEKFNDPKYVPSAKNAPSAENALPLVQNLHHPSAENALPLVQKMHPNKDINKDLNKELNKDPLSHVSENDSKKLEDLITIAKEKVEQFKDQVPNLTKININEEMLAFIAKHDQENSWGAIKNLGSAILLWLTREAKYVKNNSKRKTTKAKKVSVNAENIDVLFGIEEKEKSQVRDLTLNSNLSTPKEELTND